MENGGSTVRADRAFNDILRGANAEGDAWSQRYDFVAVTRITEGESETFFRQIRPPGANLLRVAEASTLAERIAKGEVDQATLASEVQRIRDIGSPYNAWLVIFAAACAAGFFTQFIGGNWGGFGITFLAGGIGQAVRAALQARKFGAAATICMVCAILSALIAAFGLRAGISQVVPATLIGSVGYMIPGLAAGKRIYRRCLSPKYVGRNSTHPQCSVSLSHPGGRYCGRPSGRRSEVS